MKTKNIRKKVISVVTAISLIAALSSGCVIAKNNTAGSDAITVTYNGKAIEFDVEPEIMNDRVMVPMRAIFETLGAKVKWDGETETITSKKKSKTVTMTIGSVDMVKNDETYTFDTAPVIEDGRTLIPIRAISELLGYDVEWDDETRTVIITSAEEDESWKENTGTIDLNTMKVSGEGISASGSVIIITSGGDFTVTGESADGQIVIDTEDKVKLRLSGMSLTNPSGSAIYVKNADKAYITLTEGTDNTLTDGESYTSGDDKEKGVITSCDNLEIKGKGSLTINANYKNGIDASDSLDIENGVITIKAVNDGINVNDTLTISGGTINITAESDGMQAGDIVDITDGTVNITTTGDVPESANNQAGRGMQQGEMKDFSSMTDEERESMRSEIQQKFAEMQSDRAQTADDSSDDVTSKGIKADWLIDISGGTINLTTTDHAIHSASDIEISGGDITIASGNKGISAHEDVTIDGGSINITKASEGIESKAIMTINDGDINIIASDDGLNAGGGGMGGFGGNQRGEMNFGEAQDTQSSTENQNTQSNGTAQQNMGMRGGRGMRGGMQNDMQQGQMMTPPDMQNGEMPSDMQGMTPPEMGNMQQGGRMTPPDMQNGEMPSDMQGGMTPPDMQSGDAASENTENGAMRGFGGGMGQSRETDEISTEHHIQINGGTIYIEAQSDGIDSNGTIQIDGGTVTVNAQVSGAESAFDADSAILFNGGTIIGVSGAGLDESPNSYSKQNVIIAYASSTISAGDKVKVTDSNGKTIIETTAAIGGSKIVVSTPDIKTGETYTVTAGSETLTAVVTDIITSVGTKTQSMGGGRGGMNGGRGMTQNTQQTAQ